MSDAGTYTVTVTREGCDVPKMASVDVEQKSAEDESCLALPKIMVSEGQEGVIGIIPAAKNGVVRHFVLPSGGAGSVQLEAMTTLSEEKFTERYQWQILPSGAPSGTGKKINVSVGTTRKYEVRILNRKNSKVVDKIFVWVIWAERREARVFYSESPSRSDDFCYGRHDYIGFQWVVEPEEIANFPESPNLAGQFDVTRDKEISYSNPPPTTFIGRGNLMYATSSTAVFNSLDFPIEQVTFITYAPGNDDNVSTDEDNEIYSGRDFVGRRFRTSVIGLGSWDAPNSPQIRKRADGAIGERVESTINFREYVNFLGLQSVNRMSDYIYWSSIRKYRRQTSEWEDNGVQTIIH